MEKTNLRLLLVDDDATDRELFREAIEVAGISCTINEAANGEEALTQLAEMTVVPQLIILDLNMPVKDGRATLREIKTNEQWKSIPVCIMSTSSAHFDVSNAYSNGANLFLVKPLGFRELVDMLSSLLTLFDRFVTLPKKVVSG